MNFHIGMSQIITAFATKVMIIVRFSNADKQIIKRVKIISRLHYQI